MRREELEKFPKGAREITLEELKQQLKALPREERIRRLRELINKEWRWAGDA